MEDLPNFRWALGLCVLLLIGSLLGEVKSIGLICPCPQLCMFEYSDSDGGQHRGHHFVPTVFIPVDSKDVKLGMKCSRRGNEKALKWQM